MDETFKLKIVNRKSIFYDDNVFSVVVLGKEGAFGVYKNHVNLTTTFNPSKITIRDHEEKIHVIAVCSGVFQFKNNKALILTPVSEIKEEIDLKRATKLLKEARLVFDDPNTKEDDKLLAKMYIDRAKNRIKIGKERAKQI